MGKKQAFLKMKKEIQFRPQHIAKDIDNTTIWNDAKNKEATGVLITRHWISQPSKTASVDNRNIMRAVKNNSQWHQQPPQDREVYHLKETLRAEI